MDRCTYKKMYAEGSQFIAAETTLLLSVWENLLHVLYNRDKVRKAAGKNKKVPDTVGEPVS